jgi:Na+-translocating ferredoxin:NAD+ oxidoreductase RnfE subunit
VGHCLIKQTLYFTFFDNYQGTLLALLPPGAFIGLGLIVALKNLIDEKKVSTQVAANSEAILEPQTN